MCKINDDNMYDPDPKRKKSNSFKLNLNVYWDAPLLFSSSLAIYSYVGTIVFHF